MNISEFTKLVQTNGDFESQVAAKAAIAAVTSAIKSVTASGDSINIPDFGLFSTNLQKGREGTSPSGSKYKTEDKQVPKFKAAKAFKSEVAK
jgi:nucleoid DNA-binding protein